MKNQGLCWGRSFFIGVFILGALSIGCTAYAAINGSEQRTQAWSEVPADVKYIPGEFIIKVKTTNIARGFSVPASDKQTAAPESAQLEIKFFDYVFHPIETSRKVALNRILDRLGAAEVAPVVSETAVRAKEASGVDRLVVLKSIKLA
ncbi:MAG: hypothetical protein AAB649_05845, partial [Patescibacteria group bacterium]